MRNSNLFPVNANGDVGCISWSRGNFGAVDTDAHSDFLARIVCRSVFDRRQYLVKLLSEEDRDFTAGEASCAPRRWSAHADATDMRSRS